MVKHQGRFYRCYPKTWEVIKFLTISQFLLISTMLAGQVVDSVGPQKVKGEIQKTTINGEIVNVLINGKDTLLLADLGNVNVTSPRKFASKEDRDRYYRLRRSAQKVYPYALEAIKLYREVQVETDGKKKNKKRREVKKIQNEYRGVFQDQLKKLTKTDGKVLIKMIERELDVPFYSLVKDLRGGFQAFYWQQFGKMYGYNLKDGYLLGEDPLLDAVLEDYDIPY